MSLAGFGGAASIAICSADSIGGKSGSGVLFAAKWITGVDLTSGTGNSGTGNSGVLGVSVALETERSSWSG
jgi:hypothetical protein